MQGLGTVNFGVQDVAHAHPVRIDKYQCHVPSRFDTVLVRTPGSASGNDSDGADPATPHF
ncbi:hypothetical protein PYCCODRAFT_1439828 [Trametes coccinea BRFM310]|uniref:Uncharacterized protein n=1 Tax=Trametes coccinea (strain BRFM310) TaxID=1353009 RepID=A0A1Y2I9U0_TRAC3|nr:hypothetical protein PYCCODRAFT_1439828 [Trametes coccinea BRFM310]